MDLIGPAWSQVRQEKEVSARQQLRELQGWLGSNKPSLVLRSSGVGWIAVKRGNRQRRIKSARAKIEWEELEGERSMEEVNRLAVRYCDTGGKWLFHASRQNVDGSWTRLALAMLSGDLGSSVSMIKVSPREEEDSHVIIVYNDDYQDTSQVTLRVSISHHYYNY